MDNTEALKQLDRSIKNANQLIDIGNALERLRSNKDFRKVISEGYFEQEAIRLVMLKADPHMQTPEKQAAVLRDIDSVGALAQYFRTVIQKASLADKSVKADEAAREEIVAGEDA